MWDWFIGLLTAILSALHSVVGDWGLAIIVLTVIVSIIVTPLMIHSTKSTVRMQLAQPKIKEVQERYADDPVRQKEELTKLYSELKFNPVGGCLPIFLQMPIFFGLFSVAHKVPADASLFNLVPQISRSCADIIGQGLSVTAIPYLTLEVLFAVLTFIPLVMTTSGQDAQQRSTSMMTGGLMSLLMLWFGWGVPAAVLLYYVTSAAWRVVQQVFITSRIKAQVEAQEAERLASMPVEVDVVRTTRRPRPHKKSK